MPLLSKSESRTPLASIKNDLKNNPHLTKYFAGYLATIDKDDPNITHIIEEILTENHFVFECQQMWMFSTILYRKDVSKDILKLCATYFQKKDIHDLIRAICIMILAKMGDGHAKKLVRDEYDNESSPLVISSILYCTRYFKSDERRAMKIAFGSNNYLNILIKLKDPPPMAVVMS